MQLLIKLNRLRFKLYTINDYYARDSIRLSYVIINNKTPLKLRFMRNICDIAMRILLLLLLLYVINACDVFIMAQSLREFTWCTTAVQVQVLIPSHRALTAMICL